MDACALSLISFSPLYVRATCNVAAPPSIVTAGTNSRRGSTSLCSNRAVGVRMIHDMEYGRKHGGRRKEDARLLPGAVLSNSMIVT